MMTLLMLCYKVPDCLVFSYIFGVLETHGQVFKICCVLLSLVNKIR